MAQTNIRTATSVVPVTFTLLDITPKTVFTIFATGRDLHVCIGPDAVEDCTEAGSFFLPAGAALEMQPVPANPIFVKASVSGTVSYWYS